jgi:hypothetical protein
MPEETSKAGQTNLYLIRGRSFDQAGNRFVRAIPAPRPDRAKGYPQLFEPSALLPCRRSFRQRTVGPLKNRLF